MNQVALRPLAVCLTACLAASLSLAQQTCTWKGGTNVWTDAASWTNGMPGDGDTAIILKGDVLLTNDTALLAAFTIRGGSLTFSNWNTRLIATDMLLYSGTVTHAICNTNAGLANTNRVYLSGSNIFISAGAKIIVDERGYRGGTNSVAYGQGPGGARNGGGAGYGGAGSAGTGLGPGAGGPAFGSIEEPTDPGSGGGGTVAYGVTPGSPGGGAVRIQASGTVTVNGTISANAFRPVPPLQYLAGKGSGGSVYITCNRFASTNGVIRAEGGEHSGTYWMGAGCGGGGRIAITYDPPSQAELNLTQPPQVYLSADGGHWVNNAGTARDWHKGRPGTIHLTDSGFFPGTNILHGGRIEIPGFTTWTTPSLLVSNGLAQFPAGFSLSVAGDLTTAGYAGGIEISNVTLQVGGRLLLKADVNGCSTFFANQDSRTTVAGDTLVDRCEISFHATGSNGNDLVLGGNCTLTNTGRIRVFSSVTNAATPDYGALVTVGQDVRIATGSWIYAYADTTNGGAPLFRMRNLAIQTNAGFNAVAAGYAGAFRVTAIPARGPGAGTTYGGGGHGGKGGRAGGGVTNGSVRIPLNAGSGGGAWDNSNGDYGGAGGGVIRIEAAGGVTLNGTLNASGESRGDYGAGGAGGSIYLRCRRFSGAGLLQADGGGARLVNGSGSGGGGRIAVWRASHAYTGALSVTNGTAALATYLGEPGSSYWGTLSSAGCFIQIR